MTNQSLNEQGLIQAHDLALELKEINFDLIISSPLKRALQTAEIINEHHNLPIIVNNDLREIEMDTHINADAWRDAFNTDKEKQVVGVENLKDFFARVYTAIEEIKSRNGEKTILVVSHGGVKHALAAYVEQSPLRGDMLTNRMRQCEVRLYEL